MGRDDDCVRVVVRCRPLNSKEIERKCKQAVTMDSKIGQCLISNPDAQRDAMKRFTYDSVYPENSTQEELYDQTARIIVDSVLEGFNGTIFAYGQTGTGKTHTMTGPDLRLKDKEMIGVIPRVFDHVISSISIAQDKEFLVRVSYLELYNEEVRDLLSSNPEAKLELKERPETGVYVKDLSLFVVKSVDEMIHVMKVGNKNRVTGETDMNKRSSRSHSIFSLTIESSQEIAGEQTLRAGHLHLVDLAGSERQTKTHSTGIRFKEATKINWSLTALGNVISALVNPKSKFIPYRDSKLTRLLQDSLGGNSKTVMIANIGPADYNYEESLSTLRYADRAKHIINKPKVNEDPKDAMLREFQDEITRLKELLSQQGKPADLQAIIMEHATGSGGADFEANLAKRTKELEEQHQQTLLEQEEAKKELQRQLKAMQAKVIHGGENLIDKTTAQEAALKQQAAELQERKRQEAQIRKQMEEKSEETLDLKRKYTSLQEEVEDKTKKLKKLFAKYQQGQEEIQDLHEEFDREREQIVEDLREVTQQLQLKMLIIDSFIPPSEQERIEKLAVFDEEEEEWKLTSAALVGNKAKARRRPISALGMRRPVDMSTRMGILQGTDGARRGYDNVVRNLLLDVPARTTVDLGSASMIGQAFGEGLVQAEVDALLSYEEGDVEVDLSKAATNALPDVFQRYDETMTEKPRKGSSRRRGVGHSAKVAVPKRVSRSRSRDPVPVPESDEQELYPSARGMVKNKGHYA